MNAKSIDEYKKTRRAATPIIAYRTSDWRPSVTSLMKAEDNDSPVYGWNGLDGMRAMRGAEMESGVGVQNPVEAISYFVSESKESSVIFLVFIDLWLERDDFRLLIIQAMTNARETLKESGRSIVLVGPNVSQLSDHIRREVVVIDEPLPDRSALEAIASRVAADIEKEGGKCSKQNQEDAVDAVTGLSGFEAEQAMAINATKKGFGIDGVWEAKRKQIEQTPGLSVYGGKETYKDIGGCEFVKGFLDLILNGSEPPKGIVFVDEIEKSMGNAHGDLSGVSTDQLGSLLKHMQDNDAVGIIFVGVPGGAKSAIAKATGNEAGVPTIQLDLGGSKGSLVGQSEGMIRSALKVINSVCGGRELWIATSNGIEHLKPELLRRFTLGIYYFDLPTADDRKLIWKIYSSKLNVDINELPDDEGWTGAEIKQCCDLSRRTGKSVMEMSRYVVPVCRTASQQIAELRRYADGRLLTAGSGELYQMEKSSQQAGVGTVSKRKMKLED